MSYSDVKKIVTFSDVMAFAGSIDYGASYFICKDQEVSIFLKDAFKIINGSIGREVTRVVEEKSIEELEFRNMTLSDGLCKVICSVKNDVIPALNEDSFFLFRYMNQAFYTGEMVSFELHESLYKYAKKQAIKDIVFGVSDGSAYFVKSKNKKSIYESIKESFYNGEDNIKFDLKDTSVATVRCYASTISKFSGVKFRCNIVDSEIVVYFKPLSLMDEGKNKIITILKNNFNDNSQVQMLLNELLLMFPNKLPDPIPATERIYTHNGKNFTAQEWMKQPIWVRQGYVSEYNMENEIKGLIDMTPDDDDENDF